MHHIALRPHPCWITRLDLSRLASILKTDPKGIPYLSDIVWSASMPIPLVEVTRGPLVECLHRGDLVVVDFQGRLLAWAGEPDRVSYLRSSAKPLQTLQVLLSGAADRFGFTDAELAIMCASHYGEPFHVAVVESILRKIGLDGSFLRCGTAVSLSADYALEYARQGLELTPFLSDCSGKHAGMLAVCVHRGWDLAGYVSPEHPLQRENLRILADVAEVLESAISIGVDGCSVPVFAMPLRNMALAYAKRAQPECPQEPLLGARGAGPRGGVRSGSAGPTENSSESLAPRAATAWA